jgi:hypothetical protein
MGAGTGAGIVMELGLIPGDALGAVRSRST